jgi:hypothetical protein
MSVACRSSSSAGTSTRLPTTGASRYTDAMRCTAPKTEVGRRTTPPRSSGPTAVSIWSTSVRVTMPSSCSWPRMRRTPLSTRPRWNASLSAGTSSRSNRSSSNSHVSVARSSPRWTNASSSSRLEGRGSTPRPPSDPVRSTDPDGSSLAVRPTGAVHATGASRGFRLPATPGRSGWRDQPLPAAGVNHDVMGSFHPGPEGRADGR